MPPLRGSSGATSNEKVTYRSQAISTAGRELASPFVITSEHEKNTVEATMRVTPHSGVWRTASARARSLGQRDTGGRGERQRGRCGVHGRIGHARFDAGVARTRGVIPISPNSWENTNVKTARILCAGRM